MPCTAPHSSLLSSGTITLLKLLLRIEITIGKAPSTAVIFPSKESSPIMHVFSSIIFSIILLAHNMPAAMGKSIWLPSFFKFAGAKLTVIRLTGKLNPLFFKAERTLSFDSFIDISGSPTMQKFGRPPDKSVSTSTSYPSRPYRTQVFIFDSI